jgi:hypothetical protein
MKAQIIIQTETKCICKGLLKQDVEYLHSKYSLFEDGYQFAPLYAIGVWDGKRVFFKKNGETYVYLLKEILTYLNSRQYEVQVEDNRKSPFHTQTADVDASYFSEFLNDHGTPYVLADHQITVANKLLEEGNGIALAGTGFGKAQPLWCNVLTPYGWMPMGSLEVGDLIYTPKNTLTKILGIYPQGMQDIYKITLNDGAVTYATGEHLWQVIDGNPCGGDVICILTTTQIQHQINNYKMKQISVPSISTAISFFNAPTTFDVPPYIVGLLMITTHVKQNKLFINKFHYAIVKRISVIFASHDIDFNEDIGIFSTNTQMQSYIDTVIQYINTAQYDMYLHVWSYTRLQWLQGICDGAAVLTNTGIIKVNVKNPALVHVIYKAVLLQGGTFKTNVNTNTVNTDISFSTPTPYTLFAHKPIIERFLDMQKHIVHAAVVSGRRIKNIEYYSTEPAQCILIDDIEHLYITDDCIVTHNTILNGVLCDKYNKSNCNTLTIVPATTLIKQTIKQFKKLNIDIGQYTSKCQDIDHINMITTWQTLQNNPNYIRQFQVVIVDECLAGNTTIQLVNGMKAIKNINVGDRVISYNTVTKQFEHDTVLKLHKNISPHEKMYLLEFDDGSQLEITGNHKILTTDGLIRADLLDNSHNIIDFML